MVTVNKDSSTKLTRARVLTAGGVGAALIRVSIAWTVGFMGGLLSMLRGTQ